MNARNEPLLEGEVFGRLTVLDYLGRKDYGKYKRHVYLCRCECGNDVAVAQLSLQKGATKSCGCLRKEMAAERNRSHGMSYDPRYEMWYNASRRGKEFTISIEDIHIPDKCPVLGIPLSKGKGSMTDNSPSLDRVDSSRGYTPDNIRVISFRANRLKNSFSIEEMEAVLKYMKDGKETYEKKE